MKCEGINSKKEYPMLQPVTLETTNSTTWNSLQYNFAINYNWSAL